VVIAEALRGLGRFVDRQRRDPILSADYSGRYLQLPGVEKDAVPWPSKQGVSRAARTSVTPTRWRG